jgi:arsenate reductase
MDIYFNPSCGTCRTLRSILEERGIEANYVRYLEQTPSREEIERVMGLLGIDDPREMMRTGEPVYRELGLDDASRTQLIEAMVTHPILIQRPIVIVGDRAVIARPADRVLELLGSPTQGD